MRSQSTWLKTRWLRLPVGTWLLLVLLAAVSWALGSILFIRREVVEYPMDHLFPVSDSSFLGSALALADPIALEGNKIEILNNGDEYFPAMLAAIRSAQKSISFEAFLYESSSIGTQFREALCERARNGVKVRVLLDGIGSGSAFKKEDEQAFRDGGCLFAYYHPTHSWKLNTLNHRTHRRILVIDGKLAFTGGAGFADRWKGNATHPENWRDIHARLEGPIVGRMQSAFQKHWIKSGGDLMGGPGDYPNLPAVGTLKAQMVASESFTLAPLAYAQSVAFSSATKSIFITNSYCAPSRAEVTLLCDAVKRGVVVRLLLPGKHNDQPMTKAAGRTAYGNLLKGGVEIYEYLPTMIHSKSMVIDGLFSIFGTSNFDARSAQINEEIDIAVYDAEFGQQMETLFNTDLTQAKRYRLEDFKKRGLWERFSEWIVLPLHSQM